MHQLDDKRPRPGYKAIRTATMAEDEHWYAYYCDGAFWNYGSYGGLRLRREIPDVVAWRSVTPQERRDIQNGLYHFSG